MTLRITSRTNPRIQEIVRLRNRREREKSQTYLIEGYRELLRANENNHPLSALYICRPLFLGSHEEALIDALRQKGASLFDCSEDVFHKISYRDRPDGLLAVAPQQHLSLPDLDLLLQKKNSPPFLLIAEAIEKPGNLGTILRSSDAAGVDALLVCDACTDIHNPNVVRASVGTLFTVPIIETTSQEAIAWCKDQAISIIATSPQAETLFTQSPLTQPVAIAVGTEQLGLSANWIEAADTCVRIPMQGHADSLNVATATTLLLFEVVRQRTGG